MHACQIRLLPAAKIRRSTPSVTLGRFFPITGKIRRSTPSGIEGAGSKFEGAPSKSAHELEEVELEELNEKESKKTKHGPTDVGDDSSLEGKDPSNLESPASTDKRQRQKPIPPKATKHRPENHLFASGNTVVDFVVTHYVAALLSASHSFC